MKAFIFTNGSYEDPGFYKEYLKKFNTPYIICADGGANFTQKIGLIPNIILGDMDSISKETLKYYENVELRRFPVCKDETDTQLAINHALEIGATEIVVFGALGTRLDHSLGNIYLLTRLLKPRIQGMIVDEKNSIFLVQDKKNLDLPIGTIVSLLPLGGDVEGLNIQGFKYPIANGKMTLANPYGISNVVVTEHQTISLEKGILLVDIPKD
ncbi:MAG: thiamine diphosphokinase [Eubacteriaceae bacterium]|nr:thiamine diphosphokinase [Eubacteriaceae bacterium]